MSRFKQAKAVFGAGPMGPVVKALLIINVVVFACSFLVRNTPFIDSINYSSVLLEFLGLSPKRVWQDWAFWQVFTYMFVHLEFFHILFNGLGLYWFGSELEWHMGQRKFLLFYIVCGVGAGLVSAIANIPSIGASGAIFGLLLAYGYYYPNRTLYLYFVLPIKAKYCVVIFGLIELLAMLNSPSGGRINHLAYLSGLVFAAIFLYFDHKQFSFSDIKRTLDKKKRKNKSSHLRIVRIQKNEDEETPKKPTIH